MDINQINSPDIFSYTVPQSGQLESLANRALSSGIDLYTRKDYEGAIKAFKRAIGLSPTSSYSVDAANYMAQAYLKTNNTQGAIDAYKKAIQLNPYRDDIYTSLGNLYFSDKRYQEAQQAYEQAVKLNPSSNNRFSLGQAYMYNGRYSDAENQFRQVQNLEPTKPNGFYGLGQNYAKQGLYDQAINALKKAVDIKSDFYDAYLEMGYAYADSGQIDEAKKVLELLKDKAPSLVDNLSNSIYKNQQPQFSSVDIANSTFSYYFPAGTPVSTLDAYLANANASKMFTMVFQFDKEMDRESVENIANWSISRAVGSGPGQAYNFGMAIPSTEIQIDPLPISVYYDATAKTATVKFKVPQNASADGTIDPAHIEFTFAGKDSFGVLMDPHKDQFTGFLGIA
jgi:tetratricopeptide (TPR) repeat protein